MSDSRRAVAEVVLRKLLAAHPHLADEARQYARAHIEGEAMREAEALIAPPKSPRRYTPPPEPVGDICRALAIPEGERDPWYAAAGLLGDGMLDALIARPERRGDVRRVLGDGGRDEVRDG